MEKLVALCLLAICATVQGMFGSNDICFVKPEENTAHNTIDFTLFSQTNQLSPEPLIADTSTIKASTFDASLKTKFIIHGYTDNGADDSWVADMARKMITFHKDVNVVAVNWQKKADNLYYGGAAANTQAVGESIAQLIESLVAVGATYESFHLIGHSLGSHVSGFAGKALEGKIGRITGLDPAGPCFRSKSDAFRLSKTDALFVDAIHSDGDLVIQGGFGLEQELGTADFYPNGGENQPGCSGFYLQSLFKIYKGFGAVAESVACSHSRAIKFFDESIDTTHKFLASPCTKRDNWETNCKPCDGTVTTCPQMGWSASNELKGVYYLTTKDKFPFDNDS